VAFSQERTVERHDVVIVDGGNAGISLAARLLRDDLRDVAVVAPLPVHRYEPLLDYVAGGQATMPDLERPTADVVPGGCTWIRDAVEAVDPAAMTVRTRGGRTLHCSPLVLCPGLVQDWEATPGLQSAYTDGWADSSYVPGSAPVVWPRLAPLRSGSVVSTCRRNPRRAVRPRSDLPRTRRSGVPAPVRGVPQVGGHQDLRAVLLDGRPRRGTSRGPAGGQEVHPRVSSSDA
jgi:hypothetical protein